jgi:tripartite-type tricarboxylate transporter receptor subunit TctC
VPGYDCSIWWGILAPAGTPRAIVGKLNTEMGAILRDPDTTKRLASEAAEPAVDTPEAFGKLIAADLVKWNRIAREANIRAH